MFIKGEIYTRWMFKCLSKVTKRLYFHFFQRTFLLRLVHAFLWWKANIQIKQIIIKNFFKNLDWTFVAILTHSSFALKKSYMLRVLQAANCTADHNDRVLLPSIYAFDIASPFILWKRISGDWGHIANLALSISLVSNHTIGASCII